MARRRSFSAAAKALFISQPAVSRQISSLEAEIGMPLFLRMGNHIVLTDPGRKLLVYAEEVLQTLEQATRTLHDLQDLRQGVVTLAADAYLSKYFLPRFAGEFNRRYPGLQLRVLTYAQDKLAGILADGRADLAYFCGQPDEAVLLTQEQILWEKMCFVAPGPTGPDMAANLTRYAPFICPPDVGSLTKDSYLGVLPQDTIEKDSAVVIESLEGIKTAILSGTGCSILPENLIRVEIEHGYLYASPVGLSCPVIMTYPKDARLAHPVLLFMGLMRKCLN